MQNDKSVNKLLKDLKANRETYNKDGILTSYLDVKKNAKIKQKQLEIKKERIAKVAKPIIKGLYKKKYKPAQKPEE